MPVGASTQVTVADIYWVGTVISLIAAIPSCWRAWRLMSQVGLRNLMHVHVVCLLILWCDVMLIVVYGAKHMLDLMLETELKDDAFCQAAAFFSNMSCFVRIGANALLAWVAKAGAHGQTALRVADWCYGLLVGGLLLAFAYSSTDTAGPYRGLYCAIKENDVTAVTAAPVIVCIGISLTLTLFWFYNALLPKTVHSVPPSASQAAADAVQAANNDVEGQQQAAPHMPPHMRRVVPVAEDPQSPQRTPQRGSSGSYGALTAVNLRVVGLSLRLVIVFYGCWTLVFLSSVLLVAGDHVPIWLDVLAAWLVKVQPYVDSKTVVRSILRSGYRLRGS